MEVRQPFIEWIKSFNETKSMNNSSVFHGSKIIKDYGEVIIFCDKNGNTYSKKDLDTYKNQSIAIPISIYG